MKNRTKQVVLYFTADGLLTDSQFAEFNSIPGAQHRNSSLIEPDEPCEPCHSVAGHDIPAQYLEAYDVLEVADAGDVDAAVELAAMNVAQLTAYLQRAEVEIPAGSKKAQLLLLAQQVEADAG